MLEIIIGMSDSPEEEKKYIEESIIQFAHYSSFSLLSSTPTSALTSTIQRDSQSIKESILLSIISICEKKGLIDKKRFQSLFPAISSIPSNLLSEDLMEPSTSFNMEIQLACEVIKANIEINFFRTLNN